MNDFLKKIQESDDAEKRKWLFVFSGVAIAVVVFLWLKYFNSLLGPVSPAEQQNIGGGNGLAFFETFKAGLAIVVKTIGGAIKSVVDFILQPTSYIIKP